MTYRQAKHWEHRLYVAGLHSTRVQPTLLENGNYNVSDYQIILTRPGGREVVIDSTELAKSYIADQADR